MKKIQYRAKGGQPSSRVAIPVRVHMIMFKVAAKDLNRDQLTINSADLRDVLSGQEQ